MKISIVKFALALALAGAVSACTLFGVETESTKTEYRNDSGLQSRVERLERRVERLGERLENHLTGR